MNTHVGPCRFLATSKPRKTRPDACFYRCSRCGRLLIGLPAEGISPPVCCGVEMEQLRPLCLDGVEGAELDYEILGGPNENAVRVSWQGAAPAWLWLDTFRGGQYVEPGQRDRRAVFALAGEDAYAYCDKDPCEECSFRCKNGFVLYAWLPEKGLVSLSLNRIAATSATGVNRTRMP